MKLTSFVTVKCLLMSRSIWRNSILKRSFHILVVCLIPVYLNGTWWMWFHQINTTSKLSILVIDTGYVSKSKRIPVWFFSQTMSGKPLTKFWYQVQIQMFTSFALKCSTINASVFFLVGVKHSRRSDTEKWFLFEISKYRNSWVSN